MTNNVPTPLHKRQILSELDLMVVERLFGDSPWVPDHETAAALLAALVRLGLQEHPGDGKGWRDTPLGDELNVDLIMVFMGLWDEGEAIGILQSYGLIEKAECKLLGGMSGAEFDRAYRHRVQQAYFDCFTRSR